MADGGHLPEGLGAQPQGHAFEFRINAEDPGRGFLPGGGRIEAIDAPTGPGIRLDSGVRAGQEVATTFDSMLLKLIVHGADRQSALRRARRALAEIRIHGVADQPVASDIVAVAQERGGVDNATPGRTATGDVTVNDIDPDGDALAVTEVRAGAEADGGTMRPVGTPIAGKYGTLTLNSDGTFSYALNETDPLVQALRTAGDTLVDVFTYTVSDPGNLSDQAELRIRILGQNDAPVAADDDGAARRAAPGPTRRRRAVRSGRSSTGRCRC